VHHDARALSHTLSSTLAEIACSTCAVLKQVTRDLAGRQPWLTCSVPSCFWYVGEPARAARCLCQAEALVRVRQGRGSVASISGRAGAARGAGRVPGPPVRSAAPAQGGWAPSHHLPFRHSRPFDPPKRAAERGSREPRHPEHSSSRRHAGCVAGGAQSSQLSEVSVLPARRRQLTSAAYTGRR